MAAASIALVLILSVGLVASQNDKFGHFSWNPSAIYFPQEANRRLERSDNSENLMSIRYPEHSEHDNEHDESSSSSEEEESTESMEEVTNLGDWTTSELEDFAKYWQVVRKPGILHARQYNFHDTSSVGSRCKLASGLQSKCAPITECPGALNDLVKRNIRPVRCGFKGRIEVVCCPDMVDSHKPNKPDAWLWGGSNSNNNRPGGGPNNNRPVPGSGPYTNRPPSGGNTFTNRPTKRPGVNTPMPFGGGTNLPLRSNIGQKSEAACQRYTQNAAPRVGYYIKGGVEAKLTDFPHMVLLGYPATAGGSNYRGSSVKNGTGVLWRCGGTLISETFVLTAGHCVNRLGDDEPYIARVGELDWSTDEDGAEPEDVGIRSITLHPNYNSSYSYNDIALVELAKPVTLTQAVLPACLPPPIVQPADPKYYAGKSLIVTGWGDSEFAMDKASPVLMAADMTGVELSVCNKSFSGGANEFKLPLGITNVGIICAQDLTGRSTACLGDSGGPLQEAMPKPSPLYRIVGVTSVGKVCSATTPTVYARVADYVGWIESKVWP